MQGFQECIEMLFREWLQKSLQNCQSQEQARACFEAARELIGKLDLVVFEELTKWARL